jgi:signal transduction histidine kinase
MIEDQEKNILILQQENEIEQAAREREKRFRWTLIGGVIIALLLAGLLYRQFLIKRKAHIQTEKALQDLATAHEQLKTTQTQLVDAEKMASLGLLTAGIAHEINNPINFISGNIEPLKQDITDIFAILQKHPEILEKETELSYLKEEVVELLGGMEEGANRTTEIVSGLRDFSRLDTDDLQQFDLQKGMESTLSLLRNELNDRIEIEKSYASLPLVEGFPGKLNQVFMNVLTNAIQAIPGKGTIGIITSYDAAQKQIQVSILDNGKGMSREIIAKAFDPFFTTKDVGEGTGLGLAISKGIVDQHGGSIEIKSEENVGTEVVIRIPEKFDQDSSSVAAPPRS